MDSELADRLQGLSVSYEGAGRRAAAAITGEMSRTAKSSSVARRRIAVACTALVCLVGAATFTGPGQSLAESAGDLIGLGSPSTPEQATEYARQVDLMFEDIIRRAEAGDLNADVDPSEVIRVMNMALSPSKDPQVAAEQEQQVTAILESLREAGDIPPSGQAGSYGTQAPTP